MEQSPSTHVVHPCDYCGKEIKNWRRNKKYCDNACKYQFHNDKRVLIDEDMKYVNNILAQNYELMKALVQHKDVVKIGKAELAKQGFNYDFVTQFRGDYRYCYTLSWREIEGNMILISKLATAPYKKK
jgi:hypothetical protein